MANYLDKYKERMNQLHGETEEDTDSKYDFNAKRDKYKNIYASGEETKKELGVDLESRNKTREQAITKEKNKYNYDSISKNKDFETNASKGRVTDALDTFKEVVGGKPLEDNSGNAFKQAINLIKTKADAAIGVKDDIETKLGMTDEQKDTYYYLAQTNRNEAQKYLDSIREEANAEAGKKIVSTINEADNSKNNDALKYGFGVVSGLNQWATGTENTYKALTNQQMNTSALEYANAEINNILGEREGNITLDGKNLPQMAYDTVVTVSNMIPSIAAGYLGGGEALVGKMTLGSLTGLTTMGTGVFGNAYKQKRDEGKSEKEAAAYATINTALELGLQSALGGIGKLAIGKTPANKLVKLASDKVFSKAASSATSKLVKEYGEDILGSIIGEGSEEFLQEVLDPIYSYMLGEAFNSNEDGMTFKDAIDEIDWSGAIYNGILGAVTGVGLGGVPSAIETTAKAKAVSDVGKSISKDGYTAVRDTVTEGLKANKESNAYGLAKNIVDKNMGTSKNISNYELGSLAIANEEAAINKLGNDVSSAGEEAVTSLVKEGLNSDKKSDAYKQAQKIDEKIKNKEEVTDEELGNLVVANEKVIKNEENLANTPSTIATKKLSTERKEEVSSTLESKLKGIVDNEEAIKNLVDNYEGNVSVDEYVAGVKEGITLGKHNIDADQVGKDNFVSQLSAVERNTAVAIGKMQATATIESKNAANAQKYIKELKGNVELSDSMKESMTDKEKLDVELLSRVSKALNVTFKYFDSPVDENGNHIGENGSYSKDKDGNVIIRIDRYSGKNGEGTVLFTASHELTHYIAEWSPEKFKALGDFLVSEYGDGYTVDDLVKRQIKKAKDSATHSRDLSYDVAYEEFVADSMSRMLTDTDAISKLEKLKAQDRDLWEKIRDFINDLLSKIKSIYKDLDTNTEEGLELKRLGTNLQKFSDLFAEGLYEASKTREEVYNNSIGEINLEEFSEAKNENGEDLFQIKAMMADEDVYRNMLLDNKIMKREEVNNLFDTIDNAIEKIQKNLEILDYAWDADIDDRAFSPIKPNSDPLYKVSLDFSTLCRKRLIQQVVQANLQEALDRTLSKEEGIRIRDDLIKVQEEGRQIEVACALCYVEAARMKSPQQIQNFLENREEILTTFFASKDKAYIKAEIKRAEDRVRKQLGVGDTPLKKMSGANAEKIREAKRAVKKNYKTSEAQSELIAKSKDMSISDFTTPNGLENLLKTYPDIYDAFVSYVRNATKSKGVEGDTWWRAGDAEKIGDSLIIKMNTENGLRSQSWSDFQVIHLMDYIAATIELSTKKAKVQSYTKVPDFVYLMGLTNQMINMSLIPSAEFKGTLEYDSTEGMDYKKALELRDLYPDTAGTICIGIENEQIIMLLADPTIDFVIPYHHSGMSQETRKLMHIPNWVSYQNYQNEAKLSNEAAKANAKKYGVILLKSGDPNYHKSVDFSEWFDLEVAKQNVEIENANPSNPALKEKYGVMYGSFMAMKDAAETYKKICAERGLAPKFSDEKADFTNEYGYWKLLIDRKMVNNKTGEIIEQKAVEPKFDENQIVRILNEEVERYPKVKADEEYAIRTVTQNFIERENAKKLSSNEVADVLTKPVNNVTEVSAIESGKELLSDRSARYEEYDKLLSNPEANEDKLKALVEQEAIDNGYSKKVYHGTDKFGFTEFLRDFNDYGRLGFFTSSKEEVSRTYTRGERRDIGRLTKKIDPLKDEIESVYEFYENEFDKENDVKMLVKESDIKEACLSLIEYDYKNLNNLSPFVFVAERVSENPFIHPYVREVSKILLSFEDGITTEKIDELKKIRWERAATDYHFIESYGNAYAHIINEILDVVDVQNENNIPVFFCTINDEFPMFIKNEDEFRKLVKTNIDTMDVSGIYSLYLNDSNFLEVDAKGSRWNHIPYSEGEVKYDLSEELNLASDIAEVWTYYVYETDVSDILDSVQIEHINLYDSFMEYIEENEDSEEFLKDSNIKNLLNNAKKLDKLYKKWKNSKQGKSGLSFEEAVLGGLDGVKFYKTYDLANLAEQKGYSGVKIDNVIDTANGDIIKGDVYVFFDSSQVKSADAITYDDNGNVVPLKDRFNPEVKDIRFSDRDSQGNNLTLSQIEFFKDSKARDEKGNLEIVYHGTQATFTVFNSPKTNSLSQEYSAENDMGYGIYLTNSKMDAGIYSGESKIGGDLANKIESETLFRFLNKGHYEEDQYNNEYIDEWNSIYEEVEKEFLNNSHTMSLYINIKNPVYYREVEGSIYEYNFVDYKGNIIDSSGWFDKKNSYELRKLGFDGIIDETVSKRFNTSATKHYIVFDSNQIKNIDNKAPTSDNDIRFSDRIQGLENYSEYELYNIAWNYINGIINEEDIDANIIDIAIHGSRGRGTARTDSDLDIVVQYNGDIREDDFFSALNEEPLYIENILVDINPIKENLQSYIKRSNEYDEMFLDKSIKLFDREYLDLAKDPEKNEDALRKMVDDAAKQAGYTVRAYHGTLFNDINVFNGIGLNWFSKSESYAEIYGIDGYVYDVYLNIGNTLKLPELNQDGLYLENPNYPMPSKALVNVASSINVTAADMISWAKGDYYDYAEFEEEKLVPLWVFTKTRGFRDAVSKAGYDSVSATEELKTTYGIVSSNQIKSAELIEYNDGGNIIPLSERFTSNNNDIRYSDRDYVVTTSKASMTDERINKEIDLSTAGSRKDYARAWIATISPSEFIELTTPERVRGNRDLFDKTVVSSSYQNEWDFLAELKKNSQTPFLYVDWENRKVVGHEGRHRMRALEKEGIKNVEIVVEFYYGDGYMDKSFNMQNDRLESLDHFALTGQFDEKSRTFGNLIDLIPLNEDHREEIFDKYGEKSNEGSLLYSDRNQVLAAEQKKTIESLKRENVALKKDNDNLKELVAIQKESIKHQSRLTHGKVLDQNSVLSVASKLKRYVGATENRAELAQLITPVYEYILTGEDVTMETIREKAQPAIDWLQTNDKRGTEYSQEAQDVFNYLKGMKIKLDTEQKQEVAYTYGSYNDYRKSLFGRVSINDEGISIESVWEELSQIAPYSFPADTNPNDMPTVLHDAIIDLRDQKSGEYSYYKDMDAQDIFNQIYDGYWDVKTEKTIADKYQKKISLLKANHKNTMDEVKALHKEQTKELRRDYENRIKEIRGQYQVSKSKAAESRNRTEMRHKVLKRHNELYNLLTKETKDKHVPFELKMATLEALEKINMDTTNADARLKKIEEAMKKAKTPQQLAKLQNTYNTVARQGENTKARLSAMQDVYDDLKNSFVGYAYDQNVRDMITNITNDIGNTPIREMSLEQLNKVNDLYRMVIHSIRNANNTFAENRKETISVLGNDVIESLKGKEVPERKKILEDIRQFEWSDLKPIYAMRMIGSDTLTDLFKTVRSGEDVWAIDVDEAKTYYAKMQEMYNAKSWDENSEMEFKSKNDKSFGLTLQQRMSIYAYLKRNQAQEHLELGGFVFENAEMKKGVFKYEKTVADAYNISPDVMNQIVNSLTEEQRRYVDAMQRYLSSTMGEKGNEVTRELYGVDLFKEKNYFPLKSAKQYMFESQDAAGEVKLKNSGFTKATVPHANNPIILRDFNQVWASHVDEMSMYHAFILPLEDFNRVWNYKTPMDNMMGVASVKSSLQNAYGKQVNKYISNLLKDLNGGAMSQQGAGIINKLVGKFKKGAVFASASVVVQQPSAIARAFAIVNPKYFVQTSLMSKNVKAHNEAWEEAKKYAPVCRIKEMGYFDTNVRQSTTDWILEKQYGGINEKAKAVITDSNYRDNLLSIAPSLADEITWVHIWNACKAEQKDLGYSGEEMLKRAGEKMTEVVTMTQVYDSVLTRSELMRSKDTGVKMATSFLAEPTTSLNMLVDGIAQARRGNKGVMKKAFAAVVAQIILNAVLQSIVTAARDDDDDKTYAEKYVGELAGNIIDSNPLTMIPFVKDIYSIVEGYDVERADMSIVNDLVKGLRYVTSDSMTTWKKFENLGGAIFNAVGLPVKNLMRDARSIYNVANDITSDKQTTERGIVNSVKEGIWFIGEDTISDAYKKSEKGKSQKSKEIVDQLIQNKIDSGKTEKEAITSIKQSIGRKYRDKYIEAVENEDAHTKYVIKEFLVSTGLYGNRNEVSKFLEKNWKN